MPEFVVSNTLSQASTSSSLLAACALYTSDTPPSAKMATPSTTNTEKHQNELLRRPLYFYDLPAEILATLNYTPNPKFISTEPEPTSKIGSKVQPQPQSIPTKLLGSQACALCSQTFTSILEQRSHLKSDLHHYNLKQKLHGRQPVTEDDFEKLVDTLDESLSGSDSSTDEHESDGDDSALATLLKRKAKLSTVPEDGEEASSQPKTHLLGNSPLLWLSSPKLPANHYFGTYKAIFSPTDLESPSLVDIVKSKQLEPIAIPRGGKDPKLPASVYKSPHIFMCMTGGGHFAAMVVSLAPRQHAKGTTMDREATVLSHKTFHKYTTRRKQGGSQSTSDNAKGKAKSIGAQIRRANEQALADDIRSLLVEWKPLIDTSELLFVRATGAQNRRVLFGEGDDQVLSSRDPRLRGCPFSTGRATQKELMRCFIELTRLKVREIIPVEPEKASEFPKPSTSKSNKQQAPERDEEAETAILHTTQIQSMIKRSKLPALLAYLRNNKLSSDFRFTPEDSQANVHAPTALHLAAAHSASLIVAGLLCKAAADPTVANKEGKTPFEICGDRTTRDAFRVARAEVGEDKWDWDSGNVPAAISKQDAERRLERERAEEEARKQAELKRLEREVVVPDGTGRQQKSVLQSTKGPKWEQEAKGMTPEMRMRLQREQRARAAEERFGRMQQGN